MEEHKDFFCSELFRTLSEVDAQRKSVSEAYEYLLDLVDAEVMKRYQAWRDIDKMKNKEE